MGSGSHMDECLKFSFFLTTFLIFVGGIVVIVIGAVNLHSQYIYNDIVSDGLYRTSSFIMAGGGVLIVASALLGCYAAFKDARGLLLLYITVLVALVIMFFFATILALIFQVKNDQELQFELERTLDGYKISPDVQETWDNVQYTFQCCGIHNYKDWRAQLVRTEAPISCCKEREQETNCQRNPTPYNVWETGCLEKFKNGSITTGITSLVAALISVFGLIVSCGVFRNMD